MARKVTIDVKVRLHIRADDDQSIDEVLQEMDYNFTANESTDADIEDTEIVDWEILDSK